MAINDIVQTIAEARVDARSLSDFVFKPAGFKVTRRIAPPIDTLQFYIDRFDATKATTDAYIATIPNITNAAINNTAVEGGVLADTFVTATAKTVGGRPRTQREVNSDTVHLLDFVDLSEEDHSAAVSAAIAYCKTNKKELVCGSESYNLGATVDFRYIRVNGSAATFNINHTGVGIILGGSSQAVNPIQSIHEILRKTGEGSQDSPDCQIIGAVLQTITVDYCKYIQLYAKGDGSPQDYTDSSIAYSTFNFNYTYTLELRGVGYIGWINENTFNLKRLYSLIIDGEYPHNHNIFNQGCMEKKIEIYCSGGSNIFNNLRFEQYSNQGGKSKITFTKESRGNQINVSWLGTVEYYNAMYGSSAFFDVIDDGWGNTINHTQELLSDDVNLMQLNRNSSLSTVQGTQGWTTNIKNLSEVKREDADSFVVRRNYSFIYKTNFLPVDGNQIVVFHSKSSKPMFQLRLYVYDSDKKLIATEIPNLLTVGVMNWSNTAYHYSVDAPVNNFTISFNKAATTAKFFRLAIISSGSSVDARFSDLVLSLRNFKTFSPSVSGRLNNNVQDTPTSSIVTYDTDIDMTSISVGQLCMKSDLSEIKTNTQYSSLIASEVLADGKYIKLQFQEPLYDPASSVIRYKTVDGWGTVNVSSLPDQQRIALAVNTPDLLKYSHEIYYITSKNKAILDETPIDETTP